MIYILFFILIIIYLVSYFVSQKFFSPSCLICLSYIVAVYFAILNINVWKIDLSEKTFWIIIVGVLAFVMQFVIIYFLYYGNRMNVNKLKEKNKINQIKVDSKIINIFLIFETLSLLMYIYFSMKSMNVGLDITKFFTKISSYRLMKIDGEEISGIPFYVKQLIKLSKAFFCVYSYVIINNLIYANVKNIKYKISIKYFFSFGLLVIISLFSASRFDLAIMLTYVFMLYYILSYRHNNRKKVDLKKVIKLVTIIMVVIYLFSATKELFGRTGEYTTIEYLSHYFGGSIELLDLYIRNPITKSDIWGKETFFAINNTLSNFGVINAKYTIHLEWRYSNGVSLGNVYTAFRMYYNDFGMAGVIILQILLSFIFSIGYIKSLESKENGIDFGTIIYCYCIFSLVLHSYRDFFYSQIISINYINIIIYVYVVKLIFENVKLSGRKGVIYDK